MSTSYGRRVRSAIILEKNGYLTSEFVNLDKLIGKGYIEKKRNKYIVTKLGYSVMDIENQFTLYTEGIA
jgi:hypothetical protein